MADLVKHEQELSPIQGQLEPGDWLPEQLEEDIDGKYIAILLKRKWVILAVALTIQAAVCIATFTTTRLYRSTAQIQVDPESGLLPFTDIYSDPIINEAYLRTQYNVLQSRTMARRVIDRLNLAEDPLFKSSRESSLKSLKELATQVFMPRAIDPPPPSRGTPEKETVSRMDLEDRLRANLTIEPVEGTRLINITYSSDNPEFAAKVVNTMAEEAIAHHFQTRYAAANRAADFLQEQLFDMQKEVEQSEEQLLNYGRENNLFNLGEGQNLVIRKLELLTEELTKIEAELIAKSTQNDAIRQATSENFPQILKNETIITLENLLFGLRQKLGSLSSQFGPEWREIVHLKEEISQVETQLSEAKVEASWQAKVDWQGLLERRERLLTALEEQQASAGANLIPYNILKREAETNKEIYEALLQRVKEAQITTGLKSSNIHFVDQGRVSNIPYSPNRKKNLTLGLALGLMMGVGLAFLLEHLDNTFKTAEDVEQHLHLGCLGLVPQLDMRAETMQLTEGQESDSMALVLNPFQETPSKMWEAYRWLRTSILLSHSGKPPQTILVTSSLPGEGKTTTVANLGVVLAQTGGRTLVMDLDMRTQQLSRQFGVNPELGMSSFLSGNSDLSAHIQQSRIPNLFVLPSGKTPPNAAELIGSRRMEQALELLKDYFEYIVIDSPPILSQTDAVVLSPFVDGVVLLIHGGETSRDVVKRSSARLVSVGGKILGALITKLAIRQSTYSYYYDN